MTMRVPPTEDAEWSATLAVNVLENFACSRINEGLRATRAEFASLFGRRGCTLAYVLLAVRRTNDSVNGEFSPFEACPRAKRDLTATLKRSEQRALCNYGLTSFEIVKRRESVGNFRVFESRLNAESALADGRHADVRRKNLADAIAPAKTIESRFSEQDGIVFAAFDFAQTGVNVTAQIAYIEIGTQMSDLRLAPQTAGSHASSLTKCGKCFAFCGDDAVAGIFAATNHGKAETRGHVSRNIFYTVNGKIDLPVEQGFFKFLDKNTFTANLRERRLRQLVACGFDDDNVSVGAGGLKDFLTDEFGLPLGEHAATGSNSNGANRFHGRSRFGRNSSRMASTC